jgi:hypothetical protein
VPRRRSQESVVVGGGGQALVSRGHIESGDVSRHICCVKRFEAIDVSGLCRRDDVVVADRHIREGVIAVAVGVGCPRDKSVIAGERPRHVPGWRTAISIVDVAAERARVFSNIQSKRSISGYSTVICRADRNRVRSNRGRVADRNNTRRAIDGDCAAEGA